MDEIHRSIGFTKIITHSLAYLCYEIRRNHKKNANVIVKHTNAVKPRNHG